MKKLLLLIGLAALLSGMNLAAEYNYTQDFNYISIGRTVSENFDSKTYIRPPESLPNGWKADKQADPRSVGNYSNADITLEYSQVTIDEYLIPGTYALRYSGPFIAYNYKSAIGGLISNGNPSINVYTKLYNESNNPITSLTISYNMVKHRCGTSLNGFTIQLCHSLDGVDWTSAGDSFTHSFDPDDTNEGYNESPGETISVTDETFTVSIPANSYFYLAWNLSITTGEIVDADDDDNSSAQVWGIDNVSITANGTITNPEIILEPKELVDFEYTYLEGPSPAQTFSVQGAALTANVQITAPTNYEIALQDAKDETYSQTLSLTPAGGIVDETVKIRLKEDLDIDNYDGNIQATSTNAFPKSIACDGRVNTPHPSITISKTELTGFHYKKDNGPSPAQSFTVSGSYLWEDVVITAPFNYIISTNENTYYSSQLTLPLYYGNLSATTIYVRLNGGLDTGHYNDETIAITSYPAPDKTVSCSGMVSQGVIVAWDFNEKAGNEATVNATTNNGNLETSVISRGNGIDASGLINAFSSNNFTKSPNVTKEDAINNNKYLQFSILAKEDHKVSLSTLDVNFRRSGTGPNTFQWQYSLDGFSTPGSDIGTEISYTASEDGGKAQTTINLFLIPALQNVTHITAITFRLYGWGATGSTGSFAIGRLENDDLAIGGLVESTTPLPSISVYPSSLSGFTYSLGEGPSAEQTFTVSGSLLQDYITITAPTFYEIAEDDESSEFSDTIVLEPNAGIVATTTIRVRLKEGLAAGIYDEDITASSSGASVKTVSCSGIVTALQASFTVSPSTLDGFYYTFGSGPSAPESFTVKGSNLEQNKDITITASTNYEISLDDVAYSSPITLYHQSGSLAETTIYVRLKAGLSIADYDNEKIKVTYDNTTKNVTCSGSVFSNIPHITEIIVPQYIQGTTTISQINNQRTPWVSRLRLEGLSPNTKYRYYGRFGETGDPAHHASGNVWFVNEDFTFTRTTSPGVRTQGNFAEFTTDTNGTYEGWFLGEPTGNARFEPGNELYYIITLNRGNDSGVVWIRLKTESMLKVINFGTSDDSKQGTFLRGVCSSPEKYFIFVYDNEIGLESGRPVSGTVIENDGLDVSKTTQIHSIYRTHIDGNTGAWGLIIPNSTGSKGFGGIKRIESRILATGEIYAAETSSTGMWGSVDTANQTGGDGPNHLVLGEYNPTLPVELSSFTATMHAQNFVQLTWITQTETGVQGFYLYRSLENNLVSAMRISDLIPATNTSQTQSYVYVDKELYEDGLYYYWLENVDFDGSHLYHGPVFIEYSATAINPTPIPLVTRISGIYPNPFNPDTRIAYELASPAKVSIRIYNSRGQLVKYYPTTSKEAGRYIQEWNGKDDRGLPCATGIYYIKMQVGGKVFGKKAVMLK